MDLFHGLSLYTSFDSKAIYDKGGTTSRKRTLVLRQEKGLIK